jgi:hypothetical protein
MIEMDDGAQRNPNLIRMDDDNETIANIFCFGAFADKTSGIVYHDLTGLFPFISLDGRVCFFVLYHYESNCILATPISGLDNKKIFEAYKQYFDELTAKGLKPKLNIMDNQATKHIKQFLSENKYKLQLIKPHNHKVNAADVPFRHLKMHSLQPLPPPTSTSPCNCGINSHRRNKTASISCNAPELTHQNQHTKQ